MALKQSVGAVETMRQGRYHTSLLAYAGKLFLLWLLADHPQTKGYKLPVHLVQSIPQNLTV